MQIDSNLNSLLWRWGRSKISVDNGIYKATPYLKEYQSPGYREAQTYAYDSDSVDWMTETMGKVLSQNQRQAIKCKYRWKYSKGESARFLHCSKNQYMVYFDQAIAILTKEIE